MRTTAGTVATERDDERSAGPVERWIRLGAAVLAPVTILSALLFYFGYVSTRAAYEYFGVDVDAVGLGTQDFALRSPRPLLVPLIVLLLFGLLALWLHGTVRSRIDVDSRHIPRLRTAARVAMAAGALLLLAGLALVVVYGRLRNRATYDLVIPLCLASGIALLAYGRYVAVLTGVRRSRLETSDLSGRSSRAVAAVLVFAVVMANIFWATATLAQWSGRGEAIDLSRRLNELPSVILDTKERLYIRNPVIEESELPPGDGQEFRYRYRQLRLLVHGDERMFLIPAQWSPSGTTLVVPLDENVRVQFQFENPG